MSPLRIWLHRVYLHELLAPCLLLASWLIALATNQPFSPWFTAKGVFRAFWMGVAEVWRIAPIALVFLHRKGRLAQKDTDPTQPAVLLQLGRLLLGFGLISIAYSHLKAFLPVVNGMLFDTELQDVDTALGFGTSWNQRLGAIRAEWFIQLMDYAYLSFFFYFPVVMGLALFRADCDMLDEVVQGFALVFCLGLVGYYLLPSLGSIYTHPEWHTSAKYTQIWAIRDGLARHQSQIVTGHAKHINAFFGIGAFPSLHIAHALVALAIVRSRYPRAWWIGVPFTFVMFVATLFFGWHYLVDHVGACVVAWGALRLTRWDRRRRQRSDEAPSQAQPHPKADPLDEQQDTSPSPT